MNEAEIISESGYKAMLIINSGLLSVVMILFGAVAWYFRKDWENSKTRIVQTEDTIERILLEMQRDREREKGQANLMMQMIKILAKKTDTEIGL